MTLFHRRARNSYVNAPRNFGSASSNRTVTVSARSLLSWVFGISLGLLLFLGIGVGLFQLYHYATTAEYFTVKNISINGTAHLSEDEILKLSGLNRGVNCFSVSISEIEKNIYKNQWVSKVSVKRHLPDSFEIFVTEHKPAFWSLSNGVLYYADINGTLIAPVQADKFISLPTLEILSGGEALQSNISHLLRGLREAQLPIDMRQASTVRLSAGKGIEIVMGNGAISVHVQAEDWTDNLARLNSVLHDLARRAELKHVREIWVCDGNAWIVPENSPEFQ